MCTILLNTEHSFSYRKYVVWGRGREGGGIAAHDREMEMRLGRDTINFYDTKPIQMLIFNI